MPELWHLKWRVERITNRLPLYILPGKSKWPWSDLWRYISHLESKSWEHRSGDKNSTAANWLSWVLAWGLRTLLRARIPDFPYEHLTLMCLMVGNQPWTLLFTLALRKRFRSRSNKQINLEELNLPYRANRYRRRNHTRNESVETLIPKLTLCQNCWCT